MLAVAVRLVQAVAVQVVAALCVLCVRCVPCQSLLQSSYSPPLPFVAAHLSLAALDFLVALHSLHLHHIRTDIA
jgi:hypothetical protein